MGGGHRFADGEVLYRQLPEELADHEWHEHRQARMVNRRMEERGFLLVWS